MSRQGRHIGNITFAPRTETDPAPQKLVVRLVVAASYLALVIRAGGLSMMEDRFLKRLRKRGRKGLRGWPIATVAFYGPNLSQATKVAVGIVPSENAEVEELRD